MRAELPEIYKAMGVMTQSEARAMASLTKARKPRVASEKSDIEYLLGALRSLCAEVVEVLGPPGSSHSPLRHAVHTARSAEYRVVHNKTEREARAKAKAKR